MLFRIRYTNKNNEQSSFIVSGEDEEKCKKLVIRAIENKMLSNTGVLMTRIYNFERGVEKWKQDMNQFI